MSGDKRPLSLGVDLGGTKIEVALVDASGSIMASHRGLTHLENGPEGVIADIVTLVKTSVGEAAQSAQCLGIGVAGQVDRNTGTLIFAPNLGWHNVPLRAKLEEALGLSVVVSNDVRRSLCSQSATGGG